MSSTDSRTERGSVANGAARRTSDSSSSTSQSSRAHIATICWASTSSGLAGTRSDSIAPARIRSTTTAVCTRSPRNLGKSTPRDTAPTWCPARPTRCRPLATLGGDSTWIDQVDGAHVDAELERAGGDDGRQPAGLELVLDQGPLLLAHRAVVGPGEDGRGAVAVPAWAISWAGVRAAGRRGRRGTRRVGGVGLPRSAAATASRSSQISLSRAVSRSASRRELANTRVERCVGDQVDDALLDVRPDRGAPLGPGGRPGRGRR